MTVTIADLTGGKTSGRGAFDELMRAAGDHLKQEFDKQRITGSDYSQVYLGVMTAVLQTSNQFVLTTPQLNEQIKLIIEQTANVKKNTELAQANLDNTAANTAIATKQLDLMDEQIAKAIEETKLTTKQGTQVDKNVEVMTSQIQLQEAQKNKTDADTALVNQNKINTENQNTTITKQQAKLDAEVAVLVQKKYTEEAQTLDTVNGTSVGGVLGKQIALYGAQTDGFARDAEQKLLKIMVDTWTVRQTTDGEDAPSAGVDNPSIKQIVDKAFQGVNLIPD